MYLGQIAGSVTVHPYEPTKANRQLCQKAAERVQEEKALGQHILELEAHIEELDAFARNVAHSLRAPLGLIAALAQFLERGYGGSLSDEEVRYCLRMIVQNGLRMSNLIDELLLLAMVHKKTVERMPLDMASVVAKAQERLVLMTQEFQAEITVPEAWPATLGYGPWVEEVWVNYLTNAIKYGGRPPRVELGATVLDGPSKMVRFWVSDNGPGLAPEEQPQLFTPFIRLDQDRADGYGLGLSIVRSIVGRLGGQVGVESQVGRGSTFTFTLPGIT
jgi:two-component system sensor histidine kinase/response regulator